MVGLATRAVGGVLALFAFANGIAAISLPPKAPVSGSARLMLALTSVAVVTLGVVLATGRRWSVLPLIAAVAASMIVTCGVLTLGEYIRLANIFIGDSNRLLVTYPMGLLSVVTAYGVGLAILLVDAVHRSRSHRMQPAAHPPLPLT